MTIAAAFFDLDGTLVDSLEDLTDAVNAMLGGFGKSPLDSSKVCSLVGKGARNLIQRALGSESHEEIEQGLKLFVEFNSTHITDKSQLYPGVRGALDALRKHKVKMAVISNKNESLSRLILKSLEIDHYFEAICGGDTFPEMKPSPLPLLQIAERFAIATGNTVMVGDSINDIQAGKLAKITTIGCTWGYGGLHELQEADHLADTFEEVASIMLNKL